MPRPSYQQEPVPLGALLQKALRKVGAFEENQEAEVFRAWREVIGAQMLQVAYPLHLREGVLTIEITEERWLAELHYLRGRYLQQINASLQHHSLREIRFALAPHLQPTQSPPSQEIPTTQPHQRASEPSPSPKKEEDLDASPQWLDEILPPHLQDEIEQKLSDLPEGELKESARRIMTRHYQVQQMRHRTRRPRRTVAS